jgi:hypothetical protein
MRNDFWQGHILSTTGADILVVDSVCVISKQASNNLVVLRWWYSVHAYFAIPF